MQFGGMTTTRSLALAATLAALITGAPADAQSRNGEKSAPKKDPRSVSYERVYPLRADEGVFAYSRISPDGRFLAYASETREADRPRQVLRTITVVDLKTGRILFTEPGIDAYWSNDGRRMIYLSYADARQPSVSIRRHPEGIILRDVAPAHLGDYYSWAVRDGRDLVLTIESNFYYMKGDQAEMPWSSVPSCPEIGRGARPLISKDGRHISTFVRGNVVVRSLTDCTDVFDTGIRGAKADFSWDGRYVAFHTARPSGGGYDIVIVDIKDRTVRRLPGLAGSSLFPSWTKDGRLSFRYDGDDYRGFVTASNVLAIPAQPLASMRSARLSERTWGDLFPETPRPPERVSLVMVWSTWSAHTPEALSELERARQAFAARSAGVGVLTAIDPGSRREDVDRLVATHGVRLPTIPLAPERFVRTEAANQIPTTLLFRDGRLVDQRLGAQTAAQLDAWVAGAMAAGPGAPSGAGRE